MLVIELFNNDDAVGTITAVIYTSSTPTFHSTNSASFFILMMGTINSSSVDHTPKLFKKLSVYKLL